MCGGALEVDPNLLCDSADKAMFEAENGVDQIDYIADLVNNYQVTELRESHVAALHSLAVARIFPCGGQYRNARFKVVITSSDHELPEPALVPNLVRDAVSQINDSANGMSALERAAFALWRFNWIHPFAGGNGRTSRALAYLILCMDMRMMLPGAVTVPTLIYGRRDEYIRALRAADASVRNGGALDLSAMAEFMGDVVTRQLALAIARLREHPHAQKEQDATES